MSATTTISTVASLKAYCVHNSCRSLKNLSYNYGSSTAFLGNRDHLSLRMCGRVQYSCTKNNTNKNGSSVCSTASSGPPSSSWKNWVLGTLLSMILPFWKHKWVPLPALKKEVEMVVETVDAVMEMVEKVAEGAEKVADEVADRLPEGGKLQQAVCLVEQVAKKVAEDAHAADNFIHKVEEVEKEIEKEVETIVEAVVQEKNEESKEASNNESNQ